MKTDAEILDVTCGARSIWFDKHHPDALYCDKRREEYHITTPRGGIKNIVVEPDIVCDFTDIPFPDNTFALVVWDPPHLKRVGDGLMVRQYGKLGDDWPQMLHNGFQECMRVLKQDGVLIFKWAETDIPAGKVWEAIGQKPLFGHRSGKKMGTFWGCFMKLGEKS